MLALSRRCVQYASENGSCDLLGSGILDPCHAVIEIESHHGDILESNDEPPSPGFCPLCRISFNASGNSLRWCNTRPSKLWIAEVDEV